MASSTYEISIRDSGRLTALDRTKLLDSAPEANFDRLTKLGARILKSQTALLSLVDSDRQFFKSACGLGEPYVTSRETPLSHSFCKHVVASKEPLIVRDSRMMPLVAENAAVADLNVISYLGVPIVAHGEVIGSFCVINSEPRDWTNDDIELLRELANVVEDDISLREVAMKSAALAQENSLLAAEYHHRVKNSLAVSAALVVLSGRDATSVADVVSKAQGRLNALARAHDSLIASSDQVDLDELITRLLEPYVETAANMNVRGPSVVLRSNQVTPICLIIHELSTNSAKYGALGNQGTVEIGWVLLGNHQVLLQWNEKLDNVTTPSTQNFGSKLLKMAANQLGGYCDSEWTSCGLKVSVGFPLA